MNANQTHPIITFAVQLRDRATLTEEFGPKTNSRTVTMLHPDQCGNVGYLPSIHPSIRALIHDYWRITYLPGMLCGENIEQSILSGNFTVTGLKAVYLKNNYATGDNAILNVVSETFASA